VSVENPHFNIYLKEFPTIGFFNVLRSVSLCDEYSLPVDFVNKRRPHSFGAGLANWTTPSPNGEQVEIVEAYCDPRDSKAYLEPGDEASGKLYTSPDKDYSQPYTTACIGRVMQTLSVLRISKGTIQPDIDKLVSRKRHQRPSTRSSNVTRNVLTSSMKSSPYTLHMTLCTPNESAQLTNITNGEQLKHRPHSYTFNQLERTVKYLLMGFT
ncbi:hypothetical protein L9F63_021347, partial [Diploptera punctata]